jgi:hypothetical protein
LDGTYAHRTYRPDVHLPLPARVLTEEGIDIAPWLYTEYIAQPVPGGFAQQIKPLRQTLAISPSTRCKQVDNPTA